jgi:hypothetical protein
MSIVRPSADLFDRVARHFCNLINTHTYKDTGCTAKGAELEVKADVMGWTPLMLAVSEGHLEIAKGLIRAGANIAVTDTYGATLLIIAVRRVDANTDTIIKTLEMLVEAGADLAVKDGSECTALWWATNLTVAKTCLVEYLTVAKEKPILFRLGDGWFREGFLTCLRNSTTSAIQDAMKNIPAGASKKTLVCLQAALVYDFRHEELYHPFYLRRIKWVGKYVLTRYNLPVAVQWIVCALLQVRAYGAAPEAI